MLLLAGSLRRHFLRHIAATMAARTSTITAPTLTPVTITGLSVQRSWFGGILAGSVVLSASVLTVVYVDDTAMSKWLDLC